VPGEEAGSSLITPASYLFLLLVGGAGGFLSGLLGIGGGIVMFPALLYLPPLVGLKAISVREITGLTMAQGFFAAFAATFLYKRERLISKDLFFTLGGSLFISSLAGSLLSKKVPDGPILLIFGLLAFLAATMMLIPRDYRSDDLRTEEVSFNKKVAVTAGLLMGVLLGIVGQGGAFIIIPVLLYVLKIPLRIAMGSTLAIGLLSSGAGLTGKIVTNQVPFPMAAALLAGAMPMAYIGGIVGKRTDTRVLRWLLSCLILLSAVKTWSDISRRF
jgi:uncharacterized membrane protein YfcA